MPNCEDVVKRFQKTDPSLVTFSMYHKTLVSKKSVHQVGREDTKELMISSLNLARMSSNGVLQQIKHAQGD